MYETDPDIPDDILLYDAAMGVPPSAANDEFVEFLRVMLHRYGRDKRVPPAAAAPHAASAARCATPKTTGATNG